MSAYIPISALLHRYEYNIDYHDQTIYVITTQCILHQSVVNASAKSQSESSVIIKCTFVGEFARRPIILTTVHWRTHAWYRFYFRLKWTWGRPNSAKIWTVLTKLQAVEQSGLTFRPALYIPHAGHRFIRVHLRSFSEKCCWVSETQKFTSHDRRLWCRHLWSLAIKENMWNYFHCVIDRYPFSGFTKMHPPQFKCIKSLYVVFPFSFL